MHLSGKVLNFKRKSCRKHSEAVR